MENMRFKVGDRVRIKSLDWYNENKDNNREIKFENGIFTTLKSTFLGQIMTIEEITLEKQYILMEDRYKTLWTDEMIEGLVEEEVGLVDSLSSRWVNEFELPDGYIFKDENGNVINATKIVLEKKKKSVIREEQIDNAAQEYIDSDNAVLTYSDGFCEQTDHPFVRAAFKAGVEWADNNVTQDDCSKAPKLTSQDYSNGRFGYQLPAGFEAKLTERELILTPEKPKYPKTYEECLEVLGFDITRKVKDAPIFDYDDDIIALQRLKRCRDAYWKIAGEEMGLGKPWKPDYDSGVDKYGIICMNGVVQESNPTTNWERHLNKILDFPTREMRDAFFENFKEMINQCKELL